MDLTRSQVPGPIFPISRAQPRERLAADGRVCPATNAARRVWLQVVFTPTEGCPVLLTLVHSSGLVRGLVRARPLVHSSVHSSTRPGSSSLVRLVRARPDSSGPVQLVQARPDPSTRPDPSICLVGGGWQGGDHSFVSPGPTARQLFPTEIRQRSDSSDSSDRSSPDSLTAPACASDSRSEWRRHRD